MYEKQQIDRCKHEQVILLKSNNMKKNDTKKKEN